MIRTILTLVFLAGCAVVGYLIATSPNEVEILMQDRIIKGNLYEVALWAFLASYLLQKALGLLYFVWRSPHLFSRNRQLRKKHRAESLLRKGLEEMILGHYPQAERLLVKGAQLAESLEQSTVIYYENAAIAADHQQAEQRRDEYLLAARKDSGRSHFTLLNEAELALKHGEYATAEKYLLQLSEREPRNSKIVLLLDEAYAAQEKWEQAWELSARMQGLINESSWQQKRQHYARSALQHLGHRGDGEALQAFWQQLPQALRQQPSLILSEAEALIACNQADRAEALLLEEIKGQQDLALIQAYSQLTRANYVQQWEWMQQWEKHHPEQAIFLLAKARVALKAQQPEAALQAVEEALQRAPSAEAFVLRAQILEALGQGEAALQSYRQGLTQQQALQGALLLNKE